MAGEGSWILLVVYALNRFALIIWNLIFRLFTSLLTTGRAFAQAVYEKRILATVLILLFGVGLPLQLYQEEIMTWSDQIYECGGYPTAQFIANAFPLPIIRVIWDDNIAKDWNEIGLFLWEGATNVYGDIRTMVRAGKVVGMRNAMTAVFGALGGRAGGGWPFGGGFDGSAAAWTDLFQIGLDALSGYIVSWYDAIVDTVFWLARVIRAWLIDLTAFNLSCSLCALDPSASCELREPWFPNTPDWDCDECHELQADLVGLVGQYIDASAAGFVTALSSGTSFKRIGRAAGCVMRSLWMAPIQMIDAAAEGCYSFEEIFFSADKPEDTMLFKWWFGGDPVFYNCNANPQVCCGKPSSCVFPKDGGEDLPIGFFPCFGELFRALTDDAVDDWLEFLLSVVLDFIGDAILTVERMIECSNTPGYQSCLENYPSGSSSLPGYCEYDNNNDVLPDGGLYECFDIINECLAANVSREAPLLEPLVESGILEFLLNTFWRYSLDFMVCPFADLFNAGYFANVDSFSSFDAAVNALVEGNPVLGPLFVPIQWAIGFVDGIVSTVESSIAAIWNQLNPIIEVYRCLDYCMQGEFNIIPNKYCSGPCDDTIELVECFDGGEGCDPGDELPPLGEWLRNQDSTPADETPEPSPQALAQWKHNLYTRIGVPRGSFCGKVLESTTPKRAARSGDYGKFATYMFCLTTYGARRKLAAQCAPPDLVGNLSDCSASDLGIDTNCDIFTDMTNIYKTKCNATAANTSSTPLDEFFRNNKPKSFEWLQHVSGMVQNWTRWENLGAMGTAFEQIRSTRAYGRTSEFMAEYSRMRVHQHAESPELEDLYAVYANDMISLYHRGAFRNESHPTEDESTISAGYYYSKITQAPKPYLSPLRMKSIKKNAMTKMMSLGLIQPDESYQATIEQQQNFSRISDENWETWNVINDALHIEYSDTYQFVGGVARALYTRDGTALIGMLSGSRKYVTSRNEFVTKARWNKESLVSGGQKPPTLYQFVTGRSEWQSRKPRKYWPFFPIPAEEDPSTEVFTADEMSIILKQREDTWRNKMYERMDNIHKKYEQVRESQNSTHTANEWVYNLLDGFFGIFAIGGERGLFTGLIEDTRDYWSQYSLRNFTEESVIAKVNNWTTCSIPENIDGTELHSPVCVGLMREDSFGVFSAVTHEEGQFSEQLAWPSKFVTKDCVSHYNGLGADDIFEFEFSNNCLLPTPVTSTTTCGSETCSGPLSVTASEASLTRDVVQYLVVQQNAPSSTFCATTAIVMQVPACTTVINVTGSAVQSWSMINGNSSACTNSSNPLLRVELSGAGRTIDVQYEDSVVFSTGSNFMFVENEDGLVCSNCSLRYPALTCPSSANSLVDIYRDQRPYCENQCDYCEREYAGCRANDFADVLDEFLYLTGVLPYVADDVVFGGIDAKRFELWFGPAAMLGAIFLNFILLTNISCFCCVCFFPVTALTVNLAHVLTWTMFIFFGNILPYPLVFFAIAIYAQARVPAWWELVIWGVILGVSDGIIIGARLALIIMVLSSRVQAMKKFMKPIFIVIYIIWAVWLLTLVFTFPKLGDTININSGIGSVLYAIDNSFLLSFINWQPIRQRVDSYTYASAADIPDWHTFCAWYNWANIALLILIFLFGMYPILLIVRWLWGPVAAVLASIWAALDIRSRVIRIAMRKRVREARELSQRNKERLSKALRKLARTVNKLKNRGVQSMFETSQTQTIATERKPRARQSKYEQIDLDSDDAMASDDDNNDTSATVNDSGPDSPPVDTEIIGDVETQTPVRRRVQTRLTLDGFDFSALGNAQ